MKRNLIITSVLSCWSDKMEKVKSYWKIVVGILIVCIVIAFSFINHEDEATMPIIPSAKNEVEIEYIYVDVKGEVRYPGVYKVVKETRLFQVIQQAGGLTSYADDLAINLSMKLYDQTVVYIPHVDENFASVHEEGGIHLTVVNINQASLEELMSLPGIGEVTAQEIIDYRNQEGGFSTIEDLMNVPGIGEATFERLKERISIS
jgi:competence protein ComEA